MPNRPGPSSNDERSHRPDGAVHEFQGVHMLLDGDLQREWKPQEKRLSRLVFIGRNLKRDEITQGFFGCAAAA
jgi:G3E family GTPase